MGSIRFFFWYTPAQEPQEKRRRKKKHPVYMDLLQQILGDPDLHRTWKKHISDVASDLEWARKQLSRS